MTKAITTAVVIVCSIFVAVLWLKRSREGSGDQNEFPIIYNVANFMNATELKDVENLIRNRGEQHVISIAVVSSNNAQIHVGDGKLVEPRSGRVFKVIRVEGKWQIESVESWKK